MVNSPSSASDRMFFGGFASGLDTATIIDQLVAVARRPVLTQQARLSTLTARQNGLTQLNTSLGNLATRIAALRDTSVLGARTVSMLHGVDDAGKVIATPSASAPVGTYSVEVVSLATATRVSSPQAVGAAIDPGAGMHEAGFEEPVTAGTFSINGTQFTVVGESATTVRSPAALGSAVDLGAPLSGAGLTDPPTGAGSFSINGTAIAYDAGVDSLSVLLARINASAAGVTASWDSGAKQLVLTANAGGPAAITLVDTSGNFLDKTGLLGATQAPGSTAHTLTDIIGLINTAGIGVTASLVNDASGRPNILQLSSGAPIQLGQGSDTSNFLHAAHLLESPPGATRSSVRGLGQTATGVALTDARLATALSQATGTFAINGVEIAYDASVDSLANVISRINQANAGVIATYDVLQDRVRLASETTGSTSITLQDTAGNLLAAVGLAGASQTLGANASYRVDGGALQYSTSNTVTSAVPGVSLQLRDVTLAPISVEVRADHDQVAQRLTQFVEQYNSTLSQVATLTKYDQAKGNHGPLFGDSGVQTLTQRLRSLIVSPGAGLTGDLNTLTAIGLNFGAVGSAVGTTSTLAFDRSRFDAAMQTDAEGVRRLLAGFSASATLSTAGGAVTSITGKPATATDSGSYSIVTTAGGLASVTFTPDDGSAPVVTNTTIAPGSANSTLIPGVTIQFPAVLLDAQDTITITADHEGVFKAMDEFVQSFTRTGGVMTSRNAELQARIDDVNDQITRIEERAERQRESLIRRFATLETTMARLQSQQQSLSQLVAQLGANKG